MPKQCTLIIRWLGTRMLLKKIAALWALLILSCLLASPTLFDNWSNTLHLCMLSLLLITTFRLWDDLADRTFDQQRDTHCTTRIIVQSTPEQLYPLYWFGGLLFLLCALWLYQHAGIPAITILVVLTGLIAAVYYLYYYLPALTGQRALRTALVLLKYPAMLILLTGGQLSLRTGLFASVLYGLLLAYECFEHLAKQYDTT